MGKSNWVIKMWHRERGNADKMTIHSADATGKRTERTIKVEPTKPEVGYYNGERRYQCVPKGEAERLTHKDANRIMGRLKRLGYAAIMEQVPLPSFDETRRAFKESMRRMAHEAGSKQT